MTSVPILSNIDLSEINKQFNLRINCIDVQEAFPTKRANQGNYIFNINRGQVGHWTCCHIRGKQCYYFDSFGCVPSPQILSFIKRNKLRLDWNTNDIQQLAAIDCGFYCIAFIHYMNTHPHQPNPIGSFTALFRNDTRHNSRILQHYLKQYLSPTNA